jgi:hypothetical protein
MSAAPGEGLYCAQGRFRTPWSSPSRPERPKVGYEFGSRGAVDYEQERDFGRSLATMRAARLADVTERLANEPRFLDSFKQSIDTSLGYTDAVFLAQEPELNKVLTELQFWISEFEAHLKDYREARESVVAGAGSIMFRGACVSLKEMIVMGNRLRRWLLEQATEVKPSDAHPA